MNIRFFYGFDGDYVELPVRGSTGILTDEYCRGFTGAHFGMYVHDMLDKKAEAQFESIRIIYS